MFVNVVLQVPMGEQLVIPASGVLQSGAREIVFVNHGDGIAPRDIQLAARVGDAFIVLKGLKAGEKIVTSAISLVDSESQLQAAMGLLYRPPGSWVRRQASTPLKPPPNLPPTRIHPAKAPIFSA